MYIRIRACIHVHTYVRRGVRIQVCTTRDSSTSSTIHRVRRSTPPRFNIQTICNNFAATITPSRAPVLPPSRFCNTLAFSVLPSLSLALSLFPSFFSNHHLQLRRLYRLFPPPLPPPLFPLAQFPCFFPPPILPDRVSSTARRDVARTNTPTPRLCEIAPRCGALYLHLPPCDRNHSKSPHGH